MAPPRKTDLLGRYQTQLAASKQWRSNDYDGLWGRMRDLYRGKQTEGQSESDRIIVNMAFATINVLGPAVSVNNPRFTVGARLPEHEAQAVITEVIINYLWRTNRYHGQFRKAVNDWLIFGHGWIKCGYKFVTKPKVVKDDEDTGGEEGIEDREDKPGNTETELDVQDDRPYIERISPFDVYVDDKARCPEDMRWIAQRIRRPVADVRVDKRYNSKQRKECQATSAGRFDEHDDPQPDRSPTGARELGYVDVIEFYDLKRKTYCVFADGQTDGYLIDPKEMPYNFGHPFLFLPNYEVPDNFYPMGELEQIETLQLELNETRTQMMNHRRRFSRKYLYMEDAFTEDGLNALESDDDNTMVEVQSNQDINRVIIPMPAVGTPPEFYNQSELIQADMDKVSGVSDYMRGNMPDIRRTATEAAMVQDAQNSRSAEKLSRIETFLAQVAERIIQLMQQYMTGEQVVRVIGASNMPLFLKYDKDYIKGDFDFEVEAGSTQPQNETFRRQSALQMVDAMAPFVQAGVINVPELASYVLQFGFGVKDPSSFVSGPVEQAASPVADAQAEPGGAPVEPGGPAGALPPGGQAPPVPPPGPPPAPPGAGAPPGAAAPPAAGPAPGGIAAIAQGLPPEMMEQLAMLIQSLPPEAQAALIERLSQLPPEQRVMFLQQLLQEFARAQADGSAPGAGPPVGPPVGGPPPMGP